MYKVKWLGFGHEYDSELTAKDFLTGSHIRDYCRAMNIAVPTDTPV